ncbi:MAG: hypothetical protein B7X46_14740 [Thiomonas sp. 15-66-11]|nr:MAG: hypothetical protein B7X46_14740 [Thiomonas sp. 15-66-11]
MSSANSNRHQHDDEHSRVIHINVDGEQEEAKSPTMTAAKIISEYTPYTTANHYLVQVHGHERISYQSDPNTPIELRNGMRFQTVSLGPTPVSDGTPATGAQAFSSGLQLMGYTPHALAGKTDHLTFDYEVETGSKAGMRVRIGLIVPQDFPASAPSGPHVSPRVFPINTGGAHPHGRIWADHARAFAEAEGGDWEYWSRPCSDWGIRPKTIASYMSHLWQLWDSQ